MTVHPTEKQQWHRNAYIKQSNLPGTDLETRAALLCMISFNLDIVSYDLLLVCEAMSWRMTSWKWLMTLHGFKVNSKSLYIPLEPCVLFLSWGKCQHSFPVLVLTQQIGATHCDSNKWLHWQTFTSCRIEQCLVRWGRLVKPFTPCSASRDLRFVIGQ